MTDYIMSIRPQWVRRIFDGTKTVEVRKSAPRAFVSAKAPLRVWVYETKNEGGCGKIVGTFVCRRIDYLTAQDFAANSKRLRDAAQNSGLTVQQLYEYKGAAGRIFTWKIEDARRMDAPLELDRVFPSRRLPPQSWVKSPAGPAMEGLV